MSKIPEGWSRESIGSVGDKFVGGGTPSREVKDYYNGDIPWLTVKDLSEKDFYKGNAEEKITLKAIEESSSNLIEERNIIVSTRMGLGRGIINTCPMAINQDMRAIYLKKSKVTNEYFLQWYKGNSEKVEALGSGSTVKGITLDLLKGIEIPLPSMPEQKKIAEILTSVDKVIELTEIEIEKLKNLKKGMMQDLLTKGIGHTKFKDSPIGKIPESWEKETIGSVGEKFIGGGTPSRAVSEYYNGDIPWLTVKDLSDNDFYKSTAEEKVTLKAIRESSSNLVEENNIILSTRMGLGRGVINTCAMAINQDMRAIYLKKEKITNEFFLQWYKANSEKVIGLGSGSTVKGITLDLLKAIELYLPPIPEQKKIVSILESIDKRTDSLILKLVKSKNMKKGLMQDLLTGKVRVKV
ncbi:type I restriction modification DNA specificity domain protein [Bacteriovorax sp. BSW11_IV]|uniref:restriction endonuclease subunit S n=1 Tax=Bacteriovorax sp. BSW11_IV TaxID=1353529 RepID=UPI000389FE2F|nr:restriction endonuclease subunit S [Bacteriovorax sp. BSW11_IV]EQC45177.1 type I restriction modification DNA specificity domain protein [Bacteriovorax sp. BSW11_IV]